MLNNYFTTVLRVLRKYPGYTGINVAGLAIGLACCTLILLFVRDEFSYDRFHQQADRIYRVDTESHLSDPPNHNAYTAYLLADALKAELPEVEETVRMGKMADLLVRRGDVRYYESGLSYAEPSFFTVFDIPLRRGDPATALAEPFTLVLTEAMARKYFGAVDPIGQTLQLDMRGTTHDMTVTGLIEAPPPNSHWQFDALISYATEKATAHPSQFESWTTLSSTTYLLLRPDADWKAVEAKLPALLEQHVAEKHPNAELWYRHYLQPLTDIHLNTLGLPIDSEGDIRYVYAFSTIALLILLIACINYMNLATARAMQRAREVGVRKVLGARRAQLARQFLLEAVLLCLGGFLIALVLVEVLLPLFNTLTGKALSTHVWNAPVLFAGLCGVSLLAGLVAGSYPALVLSGFRPITILRGTFRTGASGTRLRQILVVSQFAASVALIIGTLVVFYQLDYIRTKRLGFDREQVVSIPLRGQQITDRATVLKEAMARLSGIQAVSVASGVPGGALDGHGIKPVGAEKYSGLNVLAVDPDYRAVMGLEMVSGRWYEPGSTADATGFVVNEAAVAHFGLSDPLGTQLDHNGEMGPIIGVVKNFHFSSLHETIKPLILYRGSNWWDQRRLVLKLDGPTLASSLDALQTAWAQIIPESPFEYTFLDDDLDRLYATEQRAGRIFGAFAFLGIFVACLGLFGLAAFTTAQRTKEIGVRKVLGASVSSIITLLTRQFVKLVVVAFIVAAPCAYFLMNRWLDDFAYRIDLSWPIFAVAGLAALAVALLTVSYQAVSAALADPVKSLRYE